MTDLRDRIGYQPQLVDVLPNEKYPLFVAKSDVAEGNQSGSNGTRMFFSLYNSRESVFCNLQRKSDG